MSVTLTPFASPWVPTGTPFPPTTPYITNSEYLYAGTAVDTDNIVPNGSPEQNAYALANRISQASSWADTIVDQILAATSDTETQQNLLVKRDGTIRVVVDYWPILEVDSFSLGESPSQMVALTSTADFWTAGRRVLVVPVTGTVSGVTTLFPNPLGVGSRVYAAYTYVNGWPNTLLTANATHGTTTLHVASQLGFYVGRSYTIYDVVGGIEMFTISAISGTTITTAANLQFDHTVPSAPDGISVSGLPPAVKQATVSLTSALIRTRGTAAIEMAAVGDEPRLVTGFEEGAENDIAIAEDLLDKYRRIA